MKFTPHRYQVRAADWILDHPRCLLFLGTGLGKSAITLSAISRLLDYGEISRVLIIAPKKVAEGTWSGEAEQWDHLRHLKISKILGAASQRLTALKTDAQIYISSRDNILWLTEQMTRPFFDMLVIDELTSFKNPSAKRFRALRKWLPMIDRVVGLTGTPTPNGLKDLWAQVYIVDQGRRLGQFVTGYRDKWFNCVTRNNIVIKQFPKPGAEAEILNKIADITLTMRKEDYLDLPPLMVEQRSVALPSKVLKHYEAFSRDCVAKFRDEVNEQKTILANSAASLLNKLSQFANGAIYDDCKNIIHVHEEKLTALDEILECREGPVLCFYAYKHDLYRIRDRYSSQLSVRLYEGQSDLDDWNAGKIDLLLAHPASTAFGINMQHGGHEVVWFSTGWNLELWEQANARLHRQGQTSPVRCIALVASGTVDERMMAALSKKGNEQSALLDIAKGLLKDG